MSTDFERSGSTEPVNEQDGGMFAAQPIWERRGKKRGMFGARKAAAAPVVTPEPRTFAAERDYDEPLALDTPVDPVERAIYDPPRPSYDEMRPAPTAAMATTASDIETDSGLVAPIGRPSTRSDRSPKSKGMGPAAIAAGVVTLGAIGAVGWYASRSNDGIPELAPGQATESQVAAAPLPPVDLPPSPAAADTSVNPPAAAPPPRATVRAAAPAPRAERTASAARTRPAAAPSADDASVNTSTTIPSGPQPYTTLNPGAAPPPAVTPTAPVIAPTAPTSAAPPPTEAPAAIPTTPPTLPSETTPPTAEPTTTAEPPR